MSRKIILIKQELLLLVYELNRSGLLAENEKIRPILAQLEKQIGKRFSRNAETDLVCRLLLEKKKKGLHRPARHETGGRSVHAGFGQLANRTHQLATSAPSD